MELLDIIWELLRFLSIYVFIVLHQQLSANKIVIMVTITAILLNTIAHPIIFIVMIILILYDYSTEKNKKLIFFSDNPKVVIPRLFTVKK